MYLKLALRNIRRSVRDYAIYFITLLFGVAVFYAFNSIGSQQILFDMESSASASVFESTTQLLGMFSVVVACVLGFLILYANQFLIRRRKREFGTYLVLGMTPGHVSRIVLYETVLVGLISLAVGLICGVLLSQALSFFTAALFGTTMSNYQFVFSPDALVVTLACFAAIYVVVALFNTFTVSRCKLIDLIRAGERNERAGVRNPWACLVVFVAAIAVLAYAYQQLIANGLVMLDQPEFVRATIAMLVGSLMFFWSLAGFAIAVLTRLRGVYLRKLNLFTVRQIASKVNTAFLSLWAVCVLLFFSITVFSSGMGFVEVFVGGVEKANPYSATLSAGVWYGPDGTTGSSAGERERRAEMEADAPDRLALAEEYDWDMAAALEAGAPELWAETIGAWAQVSMWSLPDMTYDPIIDAAETVASPEAMRIDDLGKVRDTAVAVMSLSDFNAACALQGQPAVNLEPGTCGLVNNMEIVNALAEAVAKAAPTITVADQELTVAGPIYDTQLEDNAMAATALIFVVPDEAVEALGAEGLIPTTQTLNVMYADNGKTAAERYGPGRYRSRHAAFGYGRLRAGAQRRRQRLREPAVAGHAHHHSPRDDRPVGRHATHDHLPGALHRLHLPRVHRSHPGHPTAESGLRLGAALPHPEQARLRCGHDLPLASDPGARVLPRTAGAGGVPRGLRHRRAVRFHVRCHRREHLHSHHDGRGAYHRHLRRLYARHLPGRPRHRENRPHRGVKAL